MSIEIDSEQGICSVEIEGSRHRAPVDSLRIGTDAAARPSGRSPPSVGGVVQRTASASESVVVGSVG